MKLPFQPGIIHPHLFPEYKHPIEINYGDCFKWAWAAYKLFNDVELFSHTSHAFIKYRNKFYDSETLDGIKNYRRLRTIKDHAGMFPSPVKMSAQEFIKYWGVFNKWDNYALSAQINLIGQSLIGNGRAFG